MTYYTLVFSTSDGGRRQFRVKNVVPGLPLDTIKAAVDKLIAHDIMHAARGALERLIRMDEFTTTVTRLA